MVGTRSAFIAVFIACAVPTYAADAVFYDGAFDFGKGPTARWEEAKLRDWLWKHWHTHSPATATLHSVSMEGEGFDSEFVIARDSSGALYLSVHTTDWRRRDFPVHEARWRDQWTIAHSVARVEEPYHWDWPGKPIPDSHRLSARKFVLELKDKEGKILSHI
jgi:hypothetical protein